MLATIRLFSALQSSIRDHNYSLNTFVSETTRAMRNINSTPFCKYLSNIHRGGASLARALQSGRKARTRAAELYKLAWPATRADHFACNRCNLRTFGRAECKTFASFAFCISFDALRANRASLHERQQRQHQHQHQHQQQPQRRQQ